MSSTPVSANETGDYTSQDIQMALILRKCAPDWEASTTAEKLEGFMFFCEHFGHIKHPSDGMIPFVLRPAQVETVECWLDERYSIVLKARQVGFSTLVSIFCFWLTFFYSDRHIIMLSRTERESAKLLSHSKYLYNALPEWMKHVGPIVQFTQTRCSMSNNSALESMPSANDPARGSTAFLIVVDEIAFIPNADDAWASIEPVVDVGGSCIMLSTAYGEGNLFHKMWIGSQTHTNQFKGLFFPWHASDRDQEWYDQKKSELPDWQLAQEYPSNAEEAFLKSGRPVFDHDGLRDLIMSEPYRGRIIKSPDGPFEFEADGGPLAVWEHPRKEAVYVIGADVAMGLEHGDFSSAHVIDAKSGKVVAEWWGKIEPDLFGSHALNMLGRYYNEALLGVENNNQGLVTVTALKRVAYPNLYRARRGEAKHGLAKRTDTYGWSTNKTSKPLMIGELAGALRDKTVLIESDATLAELRSYVRSNNGGTHGSPHDDRVISLAIAVQMVKWCYLPEFQGQAPKPGPGTWGHKIEALYAKPQKVKAESHIGQFSFRVGR
tara:strand:+ start:242 stop:1885 length:1644 start_codon:yes stop_codon:yes gene_type:complete